MTTTSGIKNRYTDIEKEREGGIHLSGIKLCTLFLALVLVIRRMRLVLAFVSGSLSFFLSLFLSLSLSYFLTSLFLSFFSSLLPLLLYSSVCHVKNTSNAQDE